MSMSPNPLCPICGAAIPHKRGVPMKTCSPECGYERKRRIEAARNTRAGKPLGMLEPDPSAAAPTEPTGIFRLWEQLTFRQE